MMEIESPACLPTNEKLALHDSLAINTLAQHTSVNLTTALHHSSVLEARNPSSTTMVVESSNLESEPAIAQPSSPVETQLQEEAADMARSLVKPTADDIVAPLSNNNNTQSEESAESTPVSPPELGPLPTADLLENGCSNSPRSVDSCPEKTRSRRKPTLEDIVRRMQKTTETYCSDDSEEEILNGSLTIDMARGGTDEVDGGSTDMSCQDMDAKDGEQPLIDYPLEHGEEGYKSVNGLPIPQLPPHVIDNLEHQKECHPYPQISAGGMPSSMPVASNISETAYSPHAYTASKINNWFHGHFNGLPLFPFPPSPMDPNLAKRYLPFESKLAAEVEKDYLKCQYCERTFRRQKNLENHIENTHQGKGPVRRTRENTNDMYFKCTHCPYTTKHQSNLYVHLRIHTGERPYICGACGVQYSQSHSLKSHIINKHDGIMSYYIKEKRNRSPRGMGYMATQILPDSPMFKMPTTPIMSPQMHRTNLDLTSKTMELAKCATENLMSQSLPMSKSSPHLSMNGHASPHYADLPHNRSPGSLPQTPTNGQISGGHFHTPSAFPTNIPSPLPNPAMEESCGAIDLSKKSSGLKDHMFDSIHDKYARFHDKINCSNCMHGAKLRMLRLNVVRMLSILVPNLNFEEKGISADSDSVDELLQDVIESNTHEEDMTE